jgi:hypothetical protein
MEECVSKRPDAGKKQDKMRDAKKKAYTIFSYILPLFLNFYARTFTMAAGNMAHFTWKT